MATELATENVDIKRDVRQTILCLSPAQTKCLFLLMNLPDAHACQTNFAVPAYPDGHTGPGRLSIVGGCNNKGTEPCERCGRANWTGFTVDFLWHGNRFIEGRVDRKKFKSIKQTIAEIERRING